MAEKQYVPEPPDKYKGNQVILSSDRLLFNAKKDSVLIFAKQAIALSSAGTLNFDSEGKCIINSPKIYLGLDAKEPLLLGNKTVDLLKELLIKLKGLSEALSKMVTRVGDQEVPITNINMPAEDLLETINQIQNKIDQIKSKQNFTL